MDNRRGPKFRIKEAPAPPVESTEPVWDSFDLSGKSLARVDAEAHAFGLSYGQYTAAIRSGGIIQLLKSKGIRNYRKILRDLEVR